MNHQNLRDSVLICLCFALASYLYWHDRIVERTAPHTIYERAAGRVVRSWTTTNRIWLTYTSVPILTTNGIEYRAVVKTNYLW
jgi:hypothetical protein